MEPFRELLSSKEKFAWNEELEVALTSARAEIFGLVEKVVRGFKLGDPLKLVTDWSRRGIGYVLWQKCCSCSVMRLECCSTGWVVVAIGSRFCTGAESCYAPIEGELLGLTWALHKTSHFMLGCPRLTATVDHKPLLGLLKKGEIRAIENPRLETLAERTLRWNFDIIHVAGAKNFGPDAFSRYPGLVEEGQVGGVSQEVQDWSDTLEATVESSRGVRVVTMDVVRSTGMADSKYSALIAKLGSGYDSWDGVLSEYGRHKDELSVADGVVLYQGRVLVPRLLREDVLRALHRVHQGATGMAL